MTYLISGCSHEKAGPPKLPPSHWRQNFHARHCERCVCWNERGRDRGWEEGGGRGRVEGECGGMRVHISSHVHAHSHIQAHTNTYIHIKLHMYIYVYTYLYVYMRHHLYTHRHIYMYMYIRIYTYKACFCCE